VVGDGTAESCTEDALDVALAGGGMVTFDCGSAPVDIADNALTRCVVRHRNDWLRRFSARRRL